MNEPLEVSVANSDDLIDLGYLYTELHSGEEQIGHDHGSRILEEIAGQRGSAVLIGRHQGIAVSTCTLMILPNLTRSGRPYALIENVVTAKNHRRRGFAKGVLERAIEMAWQNQCYKVMLLTGSKEAGTLKFYSEIGFEQTKLGFQIRQLPERRG